MKNYDKKNAIYKYGKDEFQFDFYTSLSASDKAKFVNSVTYLLVGDNYNLVLKDILFDLYIVKIFTNIDVSHIISSKTLVDDAETFLNNTNIVEIVEANAEDGVIDELEHALDLNIEYKTGIHRNVISDSIASLIGTFEKKIGDFAINPDNLMGMMDMLGGISDELTMDKMLDAYAKSDMYKNHHEQTAEKNVRHKAMIDEILKGATTIDAPDYEA